MAGGRGGSAPLPARRRRVRRRPASRRRHRRPGGVVSSCAGLGNGHLRRLGADTRTRRHHRDGRRVLGDARPPRLGRCREGRDGRRGSCRRAHGLERRARARRSQRPPRHPAKRGGGGVRRSARIAAGASGTPGHGAAARSDARAGPRPGSSDDRQPTADRAHAGPAAGGDANPTTDCGAAEPIDTAGRRDSEVSPDSGRCTVSRRTRARARWRGGKELRAVVVQAQCARHTPVRVVLAAGERSPPRPAAGLGGSRSDAGLGRRDTALDEGARRSRGTAGPNVVGTGRDRGIAAVERRNGLVAGRGGGQASTHRGDAGRPSRPSRFRARREPHAGGGGRQSLGRAAGRPWRRW